MEKIVFYDTTDENILALTPVDPNWEELAIYWPRGKDYFYRIEGGVLIAIGKASSTSIDTGEGIGTGITLNGKVIGGVKSLIEENELLRIPLDWEYNAYRLCTRGIISNFGQINIMQ